MERPNYCIDVVPVEIWEKIFFRASLCRTQNLGDQVHSSEPDTRLSITKTCARWRDIALSRPLLWNTITISFDSDNRAPNYHLVDLMIARSANAPLSIRLIMIDVDETNITDPNSAELPCLMTLFNSIARWKDFELYLRGSSLPLSLEPMITTLTGSPLLESLRLDVTLAHTENDETLSALWEKSPRLHKVFLSVSDYGRITYYRSVSPTIPYDQLTSLYFHTHMSPNTRITIGMVVHILRRAPNLTSCVIANITVAHRSVISRGKYHIMPHLEYLHLSELFPVRAEELPDLPLSTPLDYITAPSLKTLAITNMTMWGQPEFEQFIVRSGCSLDELHLFNPCDLRPPTLIPILRGIPSIKGLHIGCLKNLIDPTFVTVMMAWNARRGEFELIPNLSWLSFYDPTSFDIEPNCDLTVPGIDNLVKILKARLDPPAGDKRRFKKVYVPFDKPSIETYESVRALSGDPYTLDVRFDGGDMYNIHNLWERYGNR